MKLLLDSAILIDHFNNIEKATHFISQHQKAICISAITRAEVLTSFQSKTHFRLAKEILDKFEHYPLTAIETDMAATLRRENHWKLPDAFQAAIAQQHKLKLVTRNTKDFNPQKHPFVLVPYQL